MRIYNTLGREKQDFVPLRAGEARVYSCGPTVYDLPHIGNFRTFFLTDLVRRYLEYRGHRVTLVMNITDIDDKTIRDSAEAGMTLKAFTEKYAHEFFKGLDSLNIKRADHYPKATETIPEMVAIVQALLEKGLAYIVNGSVYFSINKSPGYGKLSGTSLAGLEHGHRVDVDEYEKDGPGDFALWKRASQDELDRGTFFEAPWGKGRPGWHIECSAMSRKYLGQPFDIHIGGVDLVFPHHENEIAQSEGAFGGEFARYWVHGEHLVVNNQKMSKSKGNFFTLTDLLKKYDYNEIRFLFLSTNYRDKLNYTEASMKNAANGAAKLQLALQNLEFFIEKAAPGDELSALAEGRKKEFEAAMDDDLDTPRALRAIQSLASDIHKHPHGREGLLRAREILTLLLRTLGLFERPGEQEPLEEESLEKIREREKARAAKDFKRADALRAELLAQGVLLDDFPEGTRWRRSSQ